MFYIRLIFSGCTLSDITARQSVCFVLCVGFMFLSVSFEFLITKQPALLQLTGRAYLEVCAPQALRKLAERSPVNPTLSEGLQGDGTDRWLFAPKERAFFHGDLFIGMAYAFGLE